MADSLLRLDLKLLDRRKRRGLAALRFWFRDRKAVSVNQIGAYLDIAVLDSNRTIDHCKIDNQAQSRSITQPTSHDAPIIRCEDVCFRVAADFNYPNQSRNGTSSHSRGSYCPTDTRTSAGSNTKCKNACGSLNHRKHGTSQASSQVIRAATK